MMSRLGTHLCPNGHRVGPSIATLSEEIICPVCGARFTHPSAESFAFNSYGACSACQGLGVRSEVDVSTLVPDPDKTIAEGAVLPWNSGGRRLSMYAAGELGVRLDVPYRSLTDHERDIVLHGEPVRRQVTLRSGRNERTVRLSVNYDNAVAAVERSLHSDNERTRRLVQRFLVTRGLLGMPRHPAAARGPSFAARRAQPRRDQRAHAGRAAQLLGRPARRAQPDDDWLARRTGRQAHATARRGAELPDPRPGRRLAVDGGEAADRAHLDRAHQHHGHALRAGRAVGRAAPEQRRRAAQDDHRPGRERQFRGRGRARAGGHPQRRLGHHSAPRPVPWAAP
jgi:hypothetical protein